MEKIYKYYCLFFIGSLLPFLIVEFYFQDYITIGLLGIIGSLVFTLCVTIESLKVKTYVKHSHPLKRIDYIDFTQKKEHNNISYNYFFRKNLL